MKTSLRLSIATAAFTLLCSPVFAQYTGPSAQPPVQTVDKAAQSPDKTHVVLDGVLTSKIRDEHYNFKDNTGTIEVEIDHKRFPTTPVNEKTKVRLSGEVDKDFGSKAKIDVKQVEVLK